MTKITATKKLPTKNILVVEDEGEMGLVLDLVLSEKQYELDYVNSILTAGEYLQHRSPDVILLDNKLPDGYGVDFINYIKKKSPNTRIIMISGLGSARDVALENGADEFFEKPFSLEELNLAIERLVQPVEVNND